MEAAKPYSFRAYRPSDIPLIQNSWGSSYYSNAIGHPLLRPEEFHSHHRPIRERILNNPNTAVIICCSTNDEDHILGYVVVEKPKCYGMILHYIYVKEAFKSEKIARELIKRSIVEKPVLYTHFTIQAEKIMKKFKQRGKEDFEKYFYTPHII